MRAPNPDKDDPPGAISDQNREEQPSEFRRDESHPEPRARRPSGEPRRQRSESDDAG